MASRFTEIVVDCHDTEAQAAFWAAVLGYQVVDSSDGDVEIAPWAEEPADLADQVRRAPTVPTLMFQHVPEGKTVKNRLHLDVSPIDRTQEAEVERLIALGARHADIGQGEQSWVVLADPEGNEFCVLRSLARTHRFGDDASVGNSRGQLPPGIRTISDDKRDMRLR